MRAMVSVGLLMVSVAAAQPAVTVEDAWVRAAPPGARVMAAYMTLENRGRRAVALTGASSTQFERVEIHRSSTVDGVARMEPVERVPVPRRGTVELEPGGLHLMLIGPRSTLRDGDAVDLILELDDGWQLDMTVPVRGTPPRAR